MNRSTPGALRELLGLLKPYRLIVALAVGLGIIGGLCITLLLANINNLLHAPGALTWGCLLYTSDAADDLLTV